MKQKGTSRQTPPNDRRTLNNHDNGASTYTQDRSSIERTATRPRPTTAQSTTLGEIQTAPVAVGGVQNGKIRSGGLEHLESGSARKLLNTLVAVRKGDFS